MSGIVLSHGGEGLMSKNVKKSSDPEKFFAEGGEGGNPVRKEHSLSQERKQKGEAEGRGGAHLLSQFVEMKRVIRLNKVRWRRQKGNVWGEKKA